MGGLTFFFGVVLVLFEILTLLFSIVIVFFAVDFGFVLVEDETLPWDLVWRLGEFLPVTSFFLLGGYFLPAGLDLEVLLFLKPKVCWRSRIFLVANF